MLRFVRGQYAAIVRNGGMLAYVLDGQVDVAINNLAAAIQARHADLRMVPPGELRASSVRGGDPHVRETHHTREHDPERFAIHHLFVATH